MTVRLAVATVVLAVIGAGCGGVSSADRSSCEDFIASLECGDFDFFTLFPDPRGYCEPYDAMCHGAGSYFTCLVEGSECDEEAGIFTLAEGCEVPACD